MYLAIIVLPLLSSVASGFFGRKIGVSGSHLIACSCVVLTTLLSLVAFFEVGLNSISVSLALFKWVDCESLNVLWSFNFDSLTVSMLIPVLIVSSLVHIYSIGYMSHDPHNQRFFSYLSLFTFMMIILVTADNLLLMFLGWEGVGVCSYLLVSFWFTRIAANQSSISAFLTNRVGDCLLTIGMFAILWSFGNIDYTTIFSLSPYMNEDIITIIGICLLIGAMAKSSQIGLHVWLPMAMEGPTPVSALIHAATMVTAGVYLLMRTSPLIEYSSTVLILCLWIGAITTVFSSLIGLFQQDIKKVIAYSTMSQLGMMVIAIGLSSYNIALFHLINHAFYKGLLFLGAGAVIHAVADNQDFRKYGGLRVFLPLTYSVMLIASLSLVAFPFMTGFYSKDFILESAYGTFNFSAVTVYFIATIGAMFTTLYSVKVLYLTFLTNPNGPVVNYKNAHEGDIFMSLPLIILAVFSIFFGYITKDLFIGLGSNFFNDNSLFIHPSNEIMLNTEFAVPVLFKILPFILTITFVVISLVLSEWIPTVLINFKFNRFGYNLFGFFNQRFLIELFYNKYITNNILKLGGQTTKVLDKGSIEYIGPYGLELLLTKLSKSISKLDTGIITSYALYILIGLIFYLAIPYLFFININIFILIFGALFSLNLYNNIISTSYRYNYESFKVIKSSVSLIYIALILYFILIPYGTELISYIISLIYSINLDNLHTVCEPITVLIRDGILNFLNNSLATISESLTVYTQFIFNNSIYLNLISNIHQFGQWIILTSIHYGGEPISNFIDVVKVLISNIILLINYIIVIISSSGTACDFLFDNIISEYPVNPFDVASLNVCFADSAPNLNDYIKATASAGTRDTGSTGAIGGSRNNTPEPQTVTEWSQIISHTYNYDEYKNLDWQTIPLYHRFDMLDKALTNLGVEVDRMAKFLDVPQNTYKFVEYPGGFEITEWTDRTLSENAKNALNDRFFHLRSNIIEAKHTFNKVSDSFDKTLSDDLDIATLPQTRGLRYEKSVILSRIPRHIWK